jgi:hypothetical protein
MMCNVKLEEILPMDGGTVAWLDEGNRLSCN